MKLVLYSFFIVFATPTILGYPDVRVDQLIPGWTAKGRTSYASCRSGNFELEFGQSFYEYRGWCLVTGITAVLYKNNEAIRARSYWSSGTGYSQFEIVAERQNDTNSFCVRRVDTYCS